MLHRTPFRIEPCGPAAGYRTFSARMPSSHWRAASCAEVGCEHHRLGWTTTVDESTGLGAAQAWYIRRESGRGFREHRDEAGRTVFTFRPGQTCFAAGGHRLPVLPARYVVRDGDWRGNPTGWTRTHARVEDWVDDWATHQDRIRSLRGRG
jgi:hypothetical protein